MITLLPCRCLTILVETYMFTLTFAQTTYLDVQSVLATGHNPQEMEVADDESVALAIIDGLVGEEERRIEENEGEDDDIALALDVLDEELEVQPDRAH